MALDELNAFIAKHKISMTTSFIPYSQSISCADDKRRLKESPTYRVHRNLNWKVTIYADSKKIWSGDYSAGQGHCPSYVFNPTPEQQRVIDAECEHGFECYVGTREGETGPIAARVRPIQPRLPDVLASLALDSQAINSQTFESWASDYGYSSDSRRALAIYDACLDVALALRRGLGDAGLAELVDASADY